MEWQTASVVAIVAGAVYFLAQRMFVTRRRRKQPAQTFVPLSSVRRRSNHDCH